MSTEELLQHHLKQNQRGYCLRWTGLLFSLHCQNRASHANSFEKAATNSYRPLLYRRVVLVITGILKFGGVAVPKYYSPIFQFDIKEGLCANASHLFSLVSSAPWEQAGGSIAARFSWIIDTSSAPYLVSPFDLGANRESWGHGAKDSLFERQILRWGTGGVMCQKYWPELPS